MTTTLVFLGLSVFMLLAVVILYLNEEYLPVESIITKILSKNQQNLEKIAIFVDLARLVVLHIHLKNKKVQQRTHLCHLVLALCIVVLFASYLLADFIEDVYLKWIGFLVYYFIINVSIIIGYIVLYNMTSKYYEEIRT